MPQYQRIEIDKYLASVVATAPIRAVAESDAVQERLAEFERADVAALKAQSLYRRAARTALRATTFGTLVGALLLLPLDRYLDGAPRIVVGALQTLSLFCTLGAI